MAEAACVVACGFAPVAVADVVLGAAEAKFRLASPCLPAVNSSPEPAWSVDRSILSVLETGLLSS